MSKTISSLNHSRHGTVNMPTFLLFSSYKTTFLIVFLCIFICFPSYLYPVIKENKCNSSGNITQISCYYFDESELNKMSNNLIFKLSFYFQALFVKIVPCIFLVVFIGLLVKLLFQIRRANKQNVWQKLYFILFYFLFIYLLVLIFKTQNNELIELNNNHELSPNQIRINKQNRQLRESDHNRISIMLLIICLLVLIAELPQAILIFISILNNDFYLDVYKPLGDLMDMCVLISYSINFILYCSMSQKFRSTFSLCLVVYFRYN